MFILWDPFLYEFFTLRSILSLFNYIQNHNVFVRYFLMEPTKRIYRFALNEKKLDLFYTRGKIKYVSLLLFDILLNILFLLIFKLKIHITNFVDIINYIFLFSII